MKDHRPPTVEEMVMAYRRVKSTGLKHIRLGNIGVFARSEADRMYLMENVDPSAY